MNRSMKHYTSGLIGFEISSELRRLGLDSWIDVQPEEKPVLPPSTMMSSFADRDLSSSMHVNENLLLEAQKESSRVGSKSSRSERSVILFGEHRPNPCSSTSVHHRRVLKVQYKRINTSPIGCYIGHHVSKLNHPSKRCSPCAKDKSPF